MTLDEIAPRFKKAHRNGAGYTALCPAHPDKNPSLSIHVKPTGWIGLKCHTGCNEADVMAKVGLTTKDLAPTKGVGSPSGGTLDAAGRLWDEAVPATGTAAERYLRGRGISAGFDRVRFHPSVPVTPKDRERGQQPHAAALFRVSSGAVQAVFLKGDAKASYLDAAKKSLGPIAGHAVILQEGDGPLIIAEGPETALSVVTAGVPGTVAAVLGISGFRSYGSKCNATSLLMIGDGDALDHKTRTAFRHAASAIAKSGKTVRVLELPPNGEDLNDVLERAGVAEVRRLVEGALASAPVNAEAKEGKPETGGGERLDHPYRETPGGTAEQLRALVDAAPVVAVDGGAAPKRSETRLESSAASSLDLSQGQYTVKRRSGNGVVADVRLSHSGRLVHQDQVRLDQTAARKRFAAEAHAAIDKIDAAGVQLDLLQLLPIAESQPEVHPVREKASEPVRSAWFPGLIDLVEADGRPHYLIQTPDGAVVTATAHDAGRVVEPPDEVPWPIAASAEVLAAIGEDTDEKVYLDLVAYFTAAADLGAAERYHVFASHVALSYLYDSRATYYPELLLYADPERGKSRIGKAWVWTVFRGLHLASLREAFVLRAAHDHRASMFFDLKDAWQQVCEKDVEDVLMQRYECGSVVPRVNNPDRGAFEDTTYYKVFGPTLIATNRPIPDGSPMSSRCLPFTPPESARRFNHEVDPVAGRSLRARLVAMRARNMGTPLPTIAKPFNGRLGDISKPLLQVVRLLSPEDEAPLLKALAALGDDRKRERAGSLEGLIVEVLSGTVNTEPLVKDIAEGVNRMRSGAKPLSTVRIANVLRSLGFRTDRTRDKDRKAMMFLDSEGRQLLAQLRDKYGVAAPEDSGATGRRTAGLDAPARDGLYDRVSEDPEDPEDVSQGVTDDDVRV